MNLTYRVMDPTGNITLLVAAPVPEEAQPAVAAALMAAEPNAEQVGFLAQDAEADIALRMAGGEFCGNAAMSAAVCASEKAGKDTGAFTVRVSGAERPVRAEVARQPDGGYIATVDMPRPAAIERLLLPGAGTVPVVHIPGITHIVLTEPMPRPLAERQARAWCAALGADALGLMFLDLRAQRLTPLVYVPGADTLCWETSCASGTTAAGAYLASEASARLTVTLRQPGGSLTVEAGGDDPPRLTGTVRIGARREMEI